MNQHLRTATRHIRRSPYQALAAVFSMTVTFFVATLLAVLAYSTSNVLQFFETRPQVIAFLKDEATPEQVSRLQRELEGDQRVKEVVYVSKEQALEIYKEATQDNPLLSELVSPKVFPASLEFSLADLAFAEEVIREIEGEGAVDQVVFTASLSGSQVGDVIENLRRITRYLRIGGGVMLSFLLASSLLSLLVIVSMRIVSRREEIEILKLIGATPGFIRMPFVLEGVFYTVVGAVAGWLVVFLLILYFLSAITSYFGQIPVLPFELSGILGLFGVILGLLVAFAILLGAFGSLFALRRYLKI